MPSFKWKTGSLGQRDKISVPLLLASAVRGLELLLLTSSARLRSSFRADGGPLSVRCVPLPIVDITSGSKSRGLPLGLLGGAPHGPKAHDPGCRPRGGRHHDSVDINEGLYRLLAENAKDVIATYGPDGTFTYLSPSIETLVGIKPAELIGSTTWTVIHPDDHGRVAEEFRALLVNVGESRRIEYRAVRRDGSAAWVESYPLPILDDAGGLLGFQDVVRDVSTRRAAQEAAVEASGRLADALAAMRESEGRYRELAEQSNDIIATMALDSTSLLVTPAVRRILGYEPEELIGRKMLELTHPDDVPLSLKVFQDLLETEPGHSTITTYEFRGRHKNGSWIWLEGRPRLKHDADGNPLHFQDVVRDVTERKLGEAALRTSQSFLERTSEVAGVGGWQYDIVAQTLQWSDATCRLHDLPPGSSPTLAEAVAYYEPEGRPVIAKAVEDGIALGKGWDLELPVRSGKGRRFWARAVGSVEIRDGRPVRLVGAFQDVTAQRLIARDLAESRDLLAVTLQSICDAVITADAHGMVTWLNPVAERMTEWSNGDARGLPMHQVYKIIDEETREPIEQADKGRNTANGQDRTMLIARSGAAYGIEESASPLLDGNRSLLGSVVVFRDVSDQRRARQEIAFRASHDALTGLINRAEFETRLDSLIARHEENDDVAAVLYLDLDRFKHVNDSCGHAQGDRLLQQISTLLIDSVRSRSKDSVGRLGGDEFGIILEQCSLRQAIQIGQGICDRVEKFCFVHDGKRFSIGTSIGVLCMDFSWTSTADVLHAVDMACYAAKNAGRNRLQVWNEIECVLPERPPV